MIVEVMIGVLGFIVMMLVAAVIVVVVKHRRRPNKLSLIVDDNWVISSLVFNKEQFFWALVEVEERVFRIFIVIFLG